MEKNVKYWPLNWENIEELTLIMEILKKEYEKLEVNFDPHDFIVIQFRYGNDWEILECISKQKFEEGLYSDETLESLLKLESTLKEIWTKMKHKLKDCDLIMTFNLIPKVRPGDKYVPIKIRNNLNGEIKSIEQKENRPLLIMVSSKTKDIEKFESLVRTLIENGRDFTYQIIYNKKSEKSACIKNELGIKNFQAEPLYLKSYLVVRDQQYIYVNSNGEVVFTLVNKVQLFTDYSNPYNILLDEDQLDKEMQCEKLEKPLEWYFVLRQYLRPDELEITDGQFDFLKVYSFDENLKPQILYKFSK